MLGQFGRSGDSGNGRVREPANSWMNRSERLRSIGRWLITLLGCAGVIAIIGVGASGTSSVGNTLAVLAVALLVAASVIGIGVIVSQGRVADSTDPDSPKARSNGQRSQEWWIIGALAILAGSAVQTWFAFGTVIAGWDNVLPQGTAWIGKLFTPWLWSGSNLGGPAAQEVQLPWAVVLWSVKSLGGTAELSQRLWYTFLVIAIVLSAYCLLRLLRITAIPAAVGSLIYVFNPNSFVTAVSPVFLTAMLLLVALPAIVLAEASRRCSLKTALVLIALSTPLLGYTYQNPPLTGMVGIAFLASIAIVWILEGPKAGKEAAKVVIAGGLLLIVTCAYWLVPSLIQLKGFALATYTPVSSWIWEEVRATIENGLWLNNTWAWDQSTFYSFAANYSVFPLSFVRFLLPVTAFLALPLCFSKDQSNQLHRRRLVVGASALALFLIVLGTGTRWPGSIIFDRLYNLPFGWLIREPFRFSVIVGMAYGILVAVTLQSLGEARRSETLRSFRNRNWNENLSKLLSVLVTLVVLAPAYPLIFGQIVPGISTSQTVQYGPHHVKFPKYWTSMVDYMNSRTAPVGNLLALPQDQFSDMVAYKWGYVGVDAFMFNLLKRNVLAPNTSNYYAASPELFSSINLITTDLLSHDWAEVNNLINALGINLVLVRGDVDEGITGYPVPPPSALEAALARDPYFEPIHRDGPLVLFRLARPTNPQNRFATINTSTPNFADLSELPSGTLMVTSKQRKGVDSIIEFPPLASWSSEHGVIFSTVLERRGWNYHLDWVKSSGSSANEIGISGKQESIPRFSTRSTTTALGTELRVSIPLTGKSLVPDGNFSQGTWQPQVSDCSNGGVPKSLSSAGLRAQIRANSGPNRTPSLVLSARIDSACESMTLDWKSGAISVSLWAKSIQGGPPQLCVWQYPNFGCAPNTNLISSSNWRHYSFFIQPQQGTTSLGIYLYANAVSPGEKTVSGYSGVTAIRAAAQSLQPVITGIPFRNTKSSEVLTAPDEAFDSGWVAPRNFTRVLVDGFRVGWLGTSLATHVRYEPEREVVVGLIVSSTGFVILFGLTISTTIRRRLARNKKS